MYFHLSYIPSKFPSRVGNNQGRFPRPDNLTRPLKELVKKLFCFHSNSYIEKLGFLIYDSTCSRINGFSFDFDLDFILYSFYSCWPMQTTTKLYLTHKAFGSLLKKTGISRPESKPLASLQEEGSYWHGTTVPGGWTFLTPGFPLSYIFLLGTFHGYFKSWLSSF